MHNISSLKRCSFIHSPFSNQIDLIQGCGLKKTFGFFSLKKDHLNFQCLLCEGKLLPLRLTSLNLFQKHTDNSVTLHFMQAVILTTSYKFDNNKRGEVFHHRNR